MAHRLEQHPLSHSNSHSSLTSYPCFLTEDQASIVRLSNCLQKLRHGLDDMTYVFHVDFSLAEVAHIYTVAMRILGVPVGEKDSSVKDKLAKLLEGKTEAMIKLVARNSTTSGREADDIER